MRSQYCTLSEVMLSATAGIWVIDEDRRTVFVSDRMAKMLEYVAAEMLGRPAEEICDDFGDTERFGELDPGVRWTGHLLFRKKDGAEFWALVSTSPLLDEERGFRGGLAVFTDLAEVAPG